MNGWAEGIQSAVQYIEDNLADEIDISEAAAKAYVSEFYFRRIFSVLYGMTVGEYIRNRRLTLAAQELVSTDIKVIDAAVKYGYDSPDSFARAFSKFHGVSPSAAKDMGANLRFFAPLRIKLTLEGGSMLEYKIVKNQHLPWSESHAASIRTPLIRRYRSFGRSISAAGTVRSSAECTAYVWTVTEKISTILSQITMTQIRRYPKTVLR